MSFNPSRNSVGWDALESDLRQSFDLFPDLNLRLMLLGKTEEELNNIAAKAQEKVKTGVNKDYALQQLDVLGHRPEGDTRKTILREFQERKQDYVPPSFRQKLNTIMKRMDEEPEFLTTNGKRHSVYTYVDAELDGFSAKKAKKEKEKKEKEKEKEAAEVQEEKKQALDGYFLACLPALPVHVGEQDLIRLQEEDERLYRMCNAVSLHAVCMWCHQQLEKDGSCKCRCGKCKGTRPECLENGDCPGFFSSVAAMMVYQNESLTQFRTMIREYLTGPRVGEEARKRLLTAQIRAQHVHPLTNKSRKRKLLQGIKHRYVCPLCHASYVPKDAGYGLCAPCRAYPDLKLAMQKYAEEVAKE